MTDEELRVINGLRDKGYAVSVFTPEELGNTSRDGLESWLAECGNEFIYNESEPEDDDDQNQSQ